MPNGWSLKSKLLTLCLVLLSLIIAVGGVNYRSLTEVQSQYGMLPTKVMPKLEYLNEMFLAYRRVRITLRTLGLEDLKPEMAAEAVHDALAAIEEYEKANQNYVALDFVPGQKELYEPVHATWEEFKSIGKEVLALQKTGKPEDREKMHQIFLTACPQKAKQYTAAILELQKFHKNVAAIRVKSAEEAAVQATWWTITIVASAVLIGLTFGLLLATSIARKLNLIGQRISSAAEQTSAGSTQLATASSELSSGSAESASSLEEPVASLEELSSTIKLNSDNSSQASDLAGKSREEAQAGEQEIIQLIGAMSAISDSSRKIEEIINVIDDIAFQTNLLALNAAVEAARAGEQGKGFAVVAEAVRALAQRSAVAAKDISGLIKENVEKSHQGATIADKSGQVFKNILESVRKVADLSSEIAHASREQTNGIQQISQAMNQMDQATQSNAASAEEVAASSEEMSSQAHLLVELVGELDRVVQGSAKSRSKRFGSTTKKRGLGS